MRQKLLVKPKRVDGFQFIQVGSQTFKHLRFAPLSRLVQRGLEQLPEIKDSFFHEHFKGTAPADGEIPITIIPACELVIPLDSLLDISRIHFFVQMLVKQFAVHIVFKRTDKRIPFCIEDIENMEQLVMDGDMSGEPTECVAVLNTNIVMDCID